jgi:hypothetical protein
MKRSYYGIYHHIEPEEPGRHVDEFAGSPAKTGPPMRQAP